MQNKLQKLPNLIFTASSAIAMLAGTLSASGNVIGSFHDNGNGTTTYTYIVNNVGGPFDVASWSLDFGFKTPDWDQNDNNFGGDVTVPNLNWFAEAGIPISGQSAQDFLALVAAGDVAIGDTLMGFSFTSTFQPGTIAYYEFSAGGDSITGTTVGPVASSVPEGNGPLEALAFAALVAFGAKSGAFRERNSQFASA